MPSMILFLSLALAAPPRPGVAFCAVCHSRPLRAFQEPLSSSTRIPMTENHDRCTSSDRVRVETFRNDKANDDRDNNKARDEAYAEAWRVRTRFGHHDAVPYYKQILSHHQHSDTSAATRIAASELSLQMLDLVGRPYSSRKSTGRGTECFDVESAHMEWEHDIAKLRNLLEKSHYNHSTIRKSIFNLPVGCLTQPQHLTHDNASLERYKNNYPMGPIYARPLQPGQYLDIRSIISDAPASSSSQEPYTSSLQCLIVLFLLASCIPKSLFLSSVFDSEETLDLLLRLGLVFLGNNSSGDEDDHVDTRDEWITPLVHVFPLEIPELIQPLKANDDVIRNDSTLTDKDERRKSLLLMTDLHPTVLGLTSIPNYSQSNGDSGSGEEDGTVMYIGPDSLALVHHFHAIFLQFWNTRQSMITSSEKRRCTSGGNAETSSPLTKIVPFKVLDLCTGSGIQALSILSMLQMLPSSEGNVDRAGLNAIAVAVDINRRALRFTEFNSILNGFGVVNFETEKDSVKGKNSRMKICTVHSDLISGTVLNPDCVAKDETEVEFTNQSLIDRLLFISCQKSSNNKEAQGDGKFDVLLANPPFIPVPPKVSDNRVLSVFGNQETCHNTPQYGLFSSGGEDGEECLRAIIRIAPMLLRPGAIAAIVSEFMNPPSTQGTGLDQALCSKIEKWWNYSFDSRAASPLATKGLLFTNEFAISSATYAQRRALRDDHDDFLLWRHHLEQKGIHSVSPGLLFFRIFPYEMVNQNQSKSELECHSKSSQRERELMLVHRFVPKTANGSIWTPRNFNSVESTRIELLDLFQSYDK